MWLIQKKRSGYTDNFFFSFPFPLELFSSTFSWKFKWLFSHESGHTLRHMHARICTHTNTNRPSRMGGECWFNFANVNGNLICKSVDHWIWRSQKKKAILLSSNTIRTIYVLNDRKELRPKSSDLLGFIQDLWQLFQGQIKQATGFISILFSFFSFNIL